mmetsp:Transcript_6550/g.10707  ORF Transcript_6550/g.10707 Transcript_6550/m.10707 type:complete len:342 (+) Transcript_6550:111-1136(+)
MLSSLMSWFWLMAACSGPFITAVTMSQLSVKPVVSRDLVIIGSGPSGCTAAIYAGRALLKPLVIAGYNSGGQLMLTSDVENFPGYPEGRTGPDMMEDLIGQAKKFGAEFWQTDCSGIDVSSRPFRISTENCTVVAKSVIVATGAESTWLNAIDEGKYKGTDISTCATCDGYLTRGKEVVVVGGGDSAMEEASFLTKFASRVNIIHRSNSFRASKVMLDRAKSNSKIRIFTNRVVNRWLGNQKSLTGVHVNDAQNPSVTETIPCEAGFIAIGHEPNTKFLDNQVELDQSGYVKTRTGSTMTSVEGLFASGDVSDPHYKQAITAAGAGCQAAMEAEKWLENNS